jgi:general secretion pathway protein K
MSAEHVRELKQRLLADRAEKRRRRRKKADERGIALILVLGAITVLTVFLTQLQESTSSDVAAALSERDALKAEYLARSAINLSRMLIATEPEIAKTVQPIFMLLGQQGGVPQIPVWEFTDLVLGPFNDSVGAQTFLGTIGGDATTAKNIGITGGGRFELSIVDEDSKINLNLAAQNDFGTRDRLAEQLLGLMAPQTNNVLFEGRDGDNQFSDRQTICGALIDWADSDPSGNESQYNCDPHSQSAGSQGPEDNFYQMIGLPYRRKNSAYDSLEEARLVRGVSDDFWSTFVDPEPDNPKKRVLTVWGQNSVNVNAANAQTLLAVVCGQQFAQEPELCTDPTQMASFIMGVTLAKSMTLGLPLFGSKKIFLDTMEGTGMLAQALAAFQVKPVKFKNRKQVSDSIQLKSKRFSIYADGIVPGNKKVTKVRIHAVLDFRDAGKLGPMGSVIVGGGQMATNAATMAASTPQSGTPGSSGTSGTSGSSAPQPGSPDAILAQLNSNPAGTIIYWRVE